MKITSIPKRYPYYTPSLDGGKAKSDLLTKLARNLLFCLPPSSDFNSPSHIQHSLRLMQVARLASAWLQSS